MIKKEGLISKIIGAVILIGIIVIVVVMKNRGGVINTVTTVYSATGGGKEDLLADEEIKKIFANNYKIELENDVWSNGKTIREDVVRSDGSKYDLIFFSDQRFHDYYKTPAKEGEAQRYTVLKSDAYLYLSNEVKEYIEDVYEKTGEIVLTENNKQDNKPYLNPQYIEYLNLSEEEKSQVE